MKLNITLSQTSEFSSIKYHNIKYFSTFKNYNFHGKTPHYNFLYFSSIIVILNKTLLLLFFMYLRKIPRKEKKATS